MINAKQEEEQLLVPEDSADDLMQVDAEVTNANMFNDFIENEELLVEQKVKIQNQTCHAF